MAHPPYLREKARALRRTKQLSIDELADRLALSRSTVYCWVRDLPIPGSGAGGAWPESARRKGTRAMQRKYRLARERAYTEGLASFDALATDPTFRDFVALYIAEGYKRCRNTVAICNSDPAVMILAASWLSRLTRRRLKFCVQYHADQDPDALRRFWAQTLRVPPTGIVATRKSNSNRLSGRTWRCQHGVLTIRVCDTALRAKLEAWAARMRQSWH